MTLIDAGIVTDYWGQFPPPHLLLRVIAEGLGARFPKKAAPTSPKNAAQIMAEVAAAMGRRN